MDISSAFDSFTRTAVIVPCKYIIALGITFPCGGSSLTCTTSSTLSTRVSYVAGFGSLADDGGKSARVTPRNFWTLVQIETEKTASDSTTVAARARGRRGCTSGYFDVTAANGRRLAGERKKTYLSRCARRYVIILQLSLFYYYYR